MTKLEYTLNDLVFTWSGGAYIEISFVDSKTPFDVFNVWDYAKDEPTIERSMAGLIEYVNERYEELIQM
jgi:hypothetical protein